MEIGHDGQEFSFDNQGPCHEALIQPHRIADRLVTNGERLEFIDDGGYDIFDLWLSAGWRAANLNGWKALMYWSRTAEG